jgi:amino acid transporter
MKKDNSSSKHRILGLFQIIMINVIAVDSIRTLPFAAEYGLSLVFYYLLAALMFFIPSALVSAELASAWPQTGAIYIWVREAFGKNCSLMVIWLEWICNVVWYPTILALIAGALAYLVDPLLAENKIYMICTVLALFWGSTWINCLGMKASSWVSIVTALLGTLIPMAAVTVFGVLWYAGNHPLQIEFSWKEFFPTQGKIDNLAFLSNVLFGLIGLDMAATHAAEMKNPRKDYPKAMLFSVVIILASIIFSSLAISLVVSPNELNLVTGCLQAFSIFLEKFHLSWALPIIALCIIVGGIGGVSAWIIGPTKGLMVASQDGSLPAFLAKKNSKGAPINVLIFQGIIVSFLSLAFVVMPSVNSSFWLLSAITAQIAMVVYVFLFAAGMYLRYSKKEVTRIYKIPCKNIGMNIVGSLGCLSCFGAMVLGFIPPVKLGIGNIVTYEILLISGVVGLCMIPLAVHKLFK